jgi:photosystem II stability/assembly factor-like uncharacterized protein
MKKLLLILLFLTCLSVQSQSWLMDVKSDSAGFFDIQDAFNKYWENKTVERGSGYNVFRRWEWFWEPRVGQSGVFPHPMHNWHEWDKYKNRGIRRNNNTANWRRLGPTKTPGGYHGLGRINCIAFHPTDPNTFWVGSPSGGIWKTTDYGQNWKTSSNNNPVLGVSSIAVNPLNPDTIYIATGDGDLGSLWGMTGGPRGDNKSVGILMSADGGETWQGTGLSWEIADVVLVRKLIIDPVNPQTLLCASSNGIYRTSNSGQTWDMVQSGYFMDIEYKPGDFNTIYATSFSLTGNARVYRSTDKGETFSSALVITDGSRITLATTPANPNLVHLLVAHRTGGRLEGVYESINSGVTFTKKFSSPNILSHHRAGNNNTGQGWYDLSYAISPINENITFSGGVNTWRSLDRGQTFEIVSMWTGNANSNPNNVFVTHADKHHFIYHPLEPNTMFDCNDGGVYFSKDTGNTWIDISEGLNITQFYRIAIYHGDTGIVLGGTQDNGARILRDGEWGEATGGDGMECGIDQLDPDIMYTTYAYGRLYRSNTGFQSGFMDVQTITPPGQTGAWVTPYKLDPKNSGTIVAGYRAVFKSTNYGNSWTQISTNIAGGQLLRNLALGNQNTNVIYVGDYNRIYRSWDGGANWETVIMQSTPISYIEVHPENDSILYYTNSSYEDGIKVFKFDGTVAGNNQLTNLSGTLPNVAINCIIYEKGTQEGLYIGTDIGVFYRDQSTADWVPFNEQLPNLVVTDLKINYKYNLLYAATFAKGIWKSNLYGNGYEEFYITSLTPEHKSEEVVRTEPVSITFNTNILPGKGEISFYHNNLLLHSVDVSDSTVWIEDNKVVISNIPYEDLRNISVVIPQGAFTTDKMTPFMGLFKGEWEYQLENKFMIQYSDKQFAVYPNPSNTEMTVFCKNCENEFDISMYNAIGQQVYQQSENTGNFHQIAVNSFSPGLYWLRIHKNNKLLTTIKVSVFK